MKTFHDNYMLTDIVALALNNAVVLFLPLTTSTSVSLPTQEVLHSIPGSFPSFRPDLRHFLTSFLVEPYVVAIQKYHKQSYQLFHVVHLTLNPVNPEFPACSV